MPNFPTDDGDPAVDVQLRMTGGDVQLIIRLLSAAYWDKPLGKLDASTSVRLSFLLADLQQWLTYYRENRLHVLFGKPDETIKLKDLPAPLRWLLKTR